METPQNVKDAALFHARQLIKNNGQSVTTDQLLESAKKIYEWMVQQ